MVRQHLISDVQLHIGESLDSGFAAVHRPGMTIWDASVQQKRPAVISDGRPVFGVQEGRRRYATQRLLTLMNGKRR
jgi:hypothetical protein